MAASSESDNKVKKSVCTRLKIYMCLAWPCQWIHRPWTTHFLYPSLGNSYLLSSMACEVQHFFPLQNLCSCRSCPQIATTSERSSRITIIATMPIIYLLVFHFLELRQKQTTDNKHVILQSSLTIIYIGGGREKSICTISLAMQLAMQQTTLCNNKVTGTNAVDKWQVSQ